MDTIEATRILLQDPRRAAAWLQLADSYMDIYRDRPKGETGLMLPQQQAWLAGIIETYAEDLDGFIEFVRGLRDHMRSALQDDEAYIAMHKFYRSVLIRRIMQVRRARLDRALAAAAHKYGEPSAAQRDTWLTRLEARWGRERLEYLSDARALCSE